MLRRMPLSVAILCLVIGIGLGPLGTQLLSLDIVTDAHFFEQLTEVAVIVSLFTAGLQLRLPLNHAEWRMALSLATVAMVLTVGLIAAIGVFLLGLPLGAAILLGAIVAPTDPVLASDVQLKRSTDSDQLRFVLTGEAGVNDGTAFPFVMLGLGILGAHEIGPLGWRWWAVDVLWAVTAGLAIGAVCGSMVGKIVLYLRQHHREAVGLDNFLAVGLIGLSYGAALYAMAYGFLAVFAAGVALRRVERLAPSSPPDETIRQAAGSSEASHLATDPKTAPAYMAEAVLNFNVQLERFAEVGMVVAVGSLLSVDLVSLRHFVWIGILFLIVRPVAVTISLWRARLTSLERALIAWFGIRGIGSIYYLSYAIAHGLDTASAKNIASLTLFTVAASIVAHGVSATPLMEYYRRVQQSKEQSAPSGIESK
jgi:NhaP-type Na+/H+ or K+/H+ antiporter